MLKCLTELVAEAEVRLKRKLSMLMKVKNAFKCRLLTFHLMTLAVIPHYMIVRSVGNISRGRFTPALGHMLQAMWDRSLLHRAVETVNTSSGPLRTY